MPRPRARNPPTSAPSTPTTRSPITPKPPLCVIRAASQPARVPMMRNHVQLIFRLLIPQRTREPTGVIVKLDARRHDLLRHEHDLPQVVPEMLDGMINDFELGEFPALDRDKVYQPSRREYLEDVVDLVEHTLEISEQVLARCAAACSEFARAVPQH